MAARRLAIDRAMRRMHAIHKDTDISLFLTQTKLPLLFGGPPSIGIVDTGYTTIFDCCV
jgi:hypothetical protein